MNVVKRVSKLLRVKNLPEQRVSSSVGKSQQDGDSVLLRAVSRL